MTSSGAATTSRAAFLASAPASAPSRSPDHGAGPAAAGTRPRALLLENIHSEAHELLEAGGWQVEAHRGALQGQDLIEHLTGVQLLGIRSQTKVTREVIDAVFQRGDDLAAIGAFCIGTDQVDLSAASAYGVAAFNAPYGNTRSVVELALGQVIALTRRLTPHSHALHAGSWDPVECGVHEVRRRVLGIVGYGNIGSQLSVLAEAMGMDVVFYNTSEKLARGRARACTSLHELLARADVVTLHVDGRRQNAGIFGEEQFAAMRPGACFLNLSRGFVVDHDALRRHLLSGHLAGAAVDVFPVEPSSNGEPFTSVLQGLPNVILTPHVAGSTAEAQQEIGRFVATKLGDYARRGDTALSVNLPHLSVPAAAGRLRVSLLHRNVPGVLAELNALLARVPANVVGQHLVTRGDLGLVLTDVQGTDKMRVDPLRRQLEAMDSAVRGRVLVMDAGD